MGLPGLSQTRLTMRSAASLPRPHSCRRSGSVHHRPSARTRAKARHLGAVPSRMFSTARARKLRRCDTGVSLNESVGLAAPRSGACRFGSRFELERKSDGHVGQVSVPAAARSSGPALFHRPPSPLPSQISQAMLADARHVPSPRQRCIAARPRPQLQLVRQRDQRLRQAGLAQHRE